MVASKIEGEACSVEFWTRYTSLCLKNYLCPQKCILRYLNGTEIKCPVERIKAEHWPFFLETLATDDFLTTIFLYSNISCENRTVPGAGKQKGRLQNVNVFPIPFTLRQESVLSLCVSLGNCIKSSTVLKILNLEFLPLSSEHIQLLVEGLSKNTSLRQLSLAGCSIGDNAIKMLCEALKSSNIEWVNFSSCQLSIESVQAIASLLKFQSLTRHAEIWEKSLRYSKPILDQLQGLSRITLNNNADLGDEAAECLSEVLIDDLWLKALDIQMCNIGNKGAASLLQILTKNCVLEILDIRMNPSVGLFYSFTHQSAVTFSYKETKTQVADVADSTIERIALQLKLNNSGKVSKYELLPVILQHQHQKEKAKAKPVPSLKIKLSRYGFTRQQGQQFKSSRKNKIHRQSSRINQSPGEESKTLKSASSTEISMDMNNEEFHKQLIRKTEDLKQCVEKEKQKRKYVLQKLHKLKQENKHLKEQLENQKLPQGYTLVDDSTCLYIQETFAKFQQFLNLVKESSLQDMTNTSKTGQYASKHSILSEVLKAPNPVGHQLDTCLKQVSDVKVEHSFPRESILTENRKKVPLDAAFLSSYKNLSVESLSISNLDFKEADILGKPLFGSFPTGVFEQSNFNSTIETKTLLNNVYEEYVTKAKTKPLSFISSETSLFSAKIMDERQITYYDKSKRDKNTRPLRSNDINSNDSK